MNKNMIFAVTTFAFLVAGGSAQADDSKGTGLTPSGAALVTGAAAGTFGAIASSGESRDRAEFHDGLSKARGMAKNRHELEDLVTRLERGGGAASHTLAEKRQELEVAQADEARLLRTQVQLQKSAEHYAKVKKGSYIAAALSLGVIAAEFMKDKLTWNNVQSGVISDSREKKVTDTLDATPSGFNGGNRTTLAIPAQ